MSWHQGAARDPAIGPVTVQGRHVARARGYSLLELERCGLTESDAGRLGIAIDRERSTAIGCNVMQLRHLLKSGGAA